MENSIEEDIKILEELQIANQNCIRNSKIKNTPFIVIWKKQNKALEHILSDYKRALKENEELKENCNIDYKRECEVLALQLHLLREEAKTTEKDYNMLKEYYKEQNEVNARFIPIQKVKDKIEHYSKLQHNYIEKYDEINEGLQAMISALQELLESEE